MLAFASLMIQKLFTDAVPVSSSLAGTGLLVDRTRLLNSNLRDPLRLMVLTSPKPPGSHVYNNAASGEWTLAPMT